MSSPGDRPADELVPELGPFDQLRAFTKGVRVVHEHHGAGRVLSTRTASRPIAGHRARHERESVTPAPTVVVVRVSVAFDCPVGTLTSLEVEGAELRLEL